MKKSERELTYVPAASQAHIDSFIEMLWLEKGLSEHTQQSYRTDLTKLAIFSNNQGLKDILTIGRQNRPEIYQLQPQAIQAPIAEDLCFEVPIRRDAEGKLISSPRRT